MGFDKAKHQIDVVVYLVENNTAVPYGNSAITVKSNSVKFNVESENWPFCDAANSLSVTTDIETVEKVASNDAVVNTTNRTNTTGSSSGEPEGTEVTLPSGTSAVEFDLPTIALVDDVETNVTVTVDASSSGTSTRFDFVSKLQEPVLRSHRGVRGRVGSRIFFVLYRRLIDRRLEHQLRRRRRRNGVDYDGLAGYTSDARARTHRAGRRAERDARVPRRLINIPDWDETNSV